jgi:hypothetical protein
MSSSTKYAKALPPAKPPAWSGRPMNSLPASPRKPTDGIGEPDVSFLGQECREVLIKVLR